MREYTYTDGNRLCIIALFMFLFATSLCSQLVLPTSQMSLHLERALVIEPIIECSPLTLPLKLGILYTECCIKMFTKIDIAHLSYATTCMPASHAFDVACRTICIIVRPTVCHWFYSNFYCNVLRLTVQN